MIIFVVHSGLRCCLDSRMCHGVCPDQMLRKGGGVASAEAEQVSNCFPKSTVVEVMIALLCCFRLSPPLRRPEPT